MWKCKIRKEMSGIRPLISFISHKARRNRALSDTGQFRVTSRFDDTRT